NEWEVRIERRGHGALAADEAGELEAHLAECAACRAYAGLARGMERTMQTAGAELGERIDWARVRAGVDHGARRARRELWAGAAFAMGIIAMWVHTWQKVLASPAVVTVLLAALIPTAVLCAIAFRHTRGRARSAGAARTSDGGGAGLDARRAGRAHPGTAQRALPRGGDLRPVGGDRAPGTDPGQGVVQALVRRRIGGGVRRCG